MSEILDSMPDTKRKTGGISLTGWRRLTQTLGLLILGQWSYYGIFRCPFIVPYVSCQNCPVLTCHGRIFTMFWGFWLLLPVSVFLFGRAFCGWLCPGGLVNQLMGKLLPKKKRPSSPVLSLASWSKVGGLLLVLYVWLVWGQPRQAIPIRVGEFFNATGLTFEHASDLWITRTLFVLACVALSLAVSGFWCRFVCPTGGLLELVKKISLFKVYKTRECNLCDRCVDVCEMNTRPEEANCTNCGDCLSTCPKNAIGLGRKKRDTL